jgi:hypothetical protein
MSDTDESWLDALAGRPADAGAASANPEGASLRAAIQARRDTAALDVALEDPNREEQLIERARASGLLEPDAKSGARSRRARLPVWSAWLAAAGLACVVVTTWEVRQHPSPVLRGAPAGVIRVQSADPLKLKQDLLRELAAAGVAARGYERFGRQGIDADLPTPLPPALRDVLQQHGIAVPDDGVLQVEIESSSRP